MSTIGLVLQVVQALEPLIESLVKDLLAGKPALQSFSESLPDPLKSRIALNARKAGLK